MSFADDIRRFSVKTEAAHNKIVRAASIAEVVAITPPGAGQETYLANNLPYIERLENGSSTQAPAGMVTINMDRVSKIVAAAIEKNRV